jgi:predicted lipid carrier protein YhbT
MEVVVVHDAGITSTFTTLYKDGGLTVRLGAPVEPDLRVEYEEADYRALLRGEMQDIAKALFQGRFRLTGDLEKGVAITPVLDSEVYRRVLRRISMTAPAFRSPPGRGRRRGPPGRSP